MHCFFKSLIVIRRYHHFTHRAANHCCQSLTLQTLRILHLICKIFQNSLKIPPYLTQDCIYVGRALIFLLKFRYCSIFNYHAYKMRILVMIRPPPTPLYAFVCIVVDPPLSTHPPLDAYVINGRPLICIKSSSLLSLI